MKWRQKKSAKKDTEDYINHYSSCDDCQHKGEGHNPLEKQRTKEQVLAESLTPRERAVFELLIKGYKLQEAADELGIKYSTANTHQKSVYKKLGVNSRAECILRYGKPGKE